MIAVRPPVKNHFLDAFRFGPFGHQLPHYHSYSIFPFDIFFGFTLIETGSRRKRFPHHIINDLRIDMASATVNRETRSVG
jgi:hypothetical protein